MKDSPYQIGLPLLHLVRSSGNANDLFKQSARRTPDAKKNDIVLLAFGS